MFGWLKAFGKGAASPVALRLAGKFIPGISEAVAAVETIKALRGQNKSREDKAIQIAIAGVALTEAVAGDVLNDPAVIEATRRVIRLEVVAEKFAKQAAAMKDDLDEARADLAVLIAAIPQIHKADPSPDPPTP